MKLKLYKYLYILLYINLYTICQQIKNIIYINNNDFSVKNGVYRIRKREGDLLKFKDSNYVQTFKIITDRNIKNDNVNEQYYYIKDNELNIILSSSINEENKIIKYTDEINKDYSLWQIFPKINDQNQLIYIIQNKKTKKYWYLDNSLNQVILKEESELNLDKNYEFQIIELYKEIEDKNKHSQLLDKEPIDIVIIHKNIYEPKLNVVSKNKVKIENDNEDFIYCIKSILQNMPWIRKIYILISNFEDKIYKSDIISDKIIFINDKESSNFGPIFPNLFPFDILKMKKHNISENFILIVDKCIITSQLQKSDFFCEENGTILPSLISNEYYDINEEQMQNKLDRFLLFKESNIYPEISLVIIQKKSLLFIYKIFGNDNIRYRKKIIQPGFSQNILPMKMSEVSEIYDVILKYYEYSKIKTTYDLHFPTLYQAYIKNKYDRKVSKIPGICFNFTENERLKNINKKLPDSKLYNKEKTFLNELLPKKSKSKLNKNGNNLRHTNSINDISKIKGIDGKVLNTIKKMDDNMTMLFKGMNNLVDKMSLVMNRTLQYYNIKKNLNENNTKDIILKEIEYLKKEYNWHIFMNIILFCLIILFIINIIMILYDNLNKKISTKRKYKKHKRYY